MKKLLYLLIFFAALLPVSTLSAQSEMPEDGAKNDMIFNHLGIAFEFGTTGLGLEVAMPCTEFVTFRTGFTIMPKFSYKTDVDYTLHPGKWNEEEHEVAIKANLNMADWKLLADVYPSRNSAFHFTAGFYLGKRFPVEARNTERIEGVGPGEGIEVGGIFVRPDDNDIARVNIAARRFKPYLGIGSTRAIPKRRVNFAFDVGAQFWGKPFLKAYSPDEDVWVRVHKEDVDDEDMDKAMDIMKKVIVYPVLSFRVNFRAF